MGIDDQDRRVKSLLAKQRALALITAGMNRQVELDVQPVFDVVLEQICLAAATPMACLHLADEERGLTRLVAQRGLPSLRAHAWRGLSLDGRAAPAQAQRSGRVLALAPEDLPRGLAAVVCAPVRGAAIVVGTLSLLWVEPPDHDPDLPTFLEMVGHLLGLAIEHAGLVSELVDNLDQLMQLKSKLENRNQELDQVNQRLQEANLQLEELSITDGLTGVYNHRHLHERLTREIARSRRLGHPICLVMADLDHFKRVNDRLGHQAGDEALRLTASWLRAGLREVDLVGRYGGEEFMLVLVDCDLQAGRMVADKLRRQVEEHAHRQPFDLLGGFTVSMGVAQLGPAMGEGDLIQAADLALYRAKEGGRNRVEIAPAPSQAPAPPAGGQAH